jgi:hypothetical protein
MGNCDSTVNTGAARRCGVTVRVKFQANYLFTKKLREIKASLESSTCISHKLFVVLSYQCCVSKCKVKEKVNFTLEQATKANRESRSIAIIFINLGARWWWFNEDTPRPPLPPGKTRYPCV